MFIIKHEIMTNFIVPTLSLTTGFWSYALYFYQSVLATAKKKKKDGAGKDNSCMSTHAECQNGEPLKKLLFYTAIKFHEGPGNPVCAVCSEPTRLLK